MNADQTPNRGREHSREVLSIDYANRPMARGVGNLPYSPPFPSQPFVPADQYHDPRTSDEEFELKTNPAPSSQSSHDRSPPPPLFDAIPLGTHDHGRNARYPNRTEKGYRSRNTSPTPNGRLGNWSGPAKNASPYGVLGGSDETSGLHSATASNPNLLFADGDSPIKQPSNAFSRFVFAIWESHFLIRWIVYIAPIMGLLWIPGILGLTVRPDTRIWGVPMFWWSCWVGGVIWGGWWASALVARMIPGFLRVTVSIVAPSLHHYASYAQALQFYIGAAAWAAGNWITIGPLINSRAITSPPNPSAPTLALITQGVFGVWIVLMMLLGEKLLIQMVAHSFHKKSYEDRIVEQKEQIRVLVTLYLNSHDIGRRDTLDGEAFKRPNPRRTGSDPTMLVKQALKGARSAARTATTVLGSVASEIAGERVLQPNSPDSMVSLALGSSNKTKQLARRIYYSFVPSFRTSLLVTDIARCFADRDAGEKAFTFFDKDGNGDASLEEIETACLGVHRERKALTNSMHDIDSAVARLDSIFVTLWSIVATIIIIGFLNASFQTMIAGAGTLILGLSWMFAVTAQEILASIVFLFIKHAYDVGDRVDIDGESYVVLEMHLLSTIFRRVDGKVVQAPHSILNTKFIQNIRRSGAISETFTWDVAFGTSFKAIEALRDQMMEFLETERRDFLPKIDILVKDFPGQSRLSLSADICYRSNWQNGALKVRRRNAWICQLKNCMGSLEIFGPDDVGNPTPPPVDPISYTIVPYVDPFTSATTTSAQLRPETTESEITRVGPNSTANPSSGLNIRLDGANAVMDDIMEGMSSDDDDTGVRRRSSGVQRKSSRKNR